MNMIIYKATEKVNEFLNFADLPGIDDTTAKTTMPSGFEKVAQLLGWARWGALVVCIAALIGFFAHLAMERQNGGGQGSIGWLGKILVAIIGISAAITFVGLLVGN